MGTFMKLLILVGIFLLIKYVIWPILADFLDIILPVLIGIAVIGGILLITWICSDSVGDFIVRLIEYGLILGLAALVYWLFTSEIGLVICNSILCGGAIVYLVYSLIKNITISDGFGDFIINEIVSLIFPFALFGIFKMFSKAKLSRPAQDHYPLDEATVWGMLAGMTCSKCKYYNSDANSCKRCIPIPSCQSGTRVCEFFECCEES